MQKPLQKIYGLLGTISILAAFGVLLVYYHHLTPFRMQANFRHQKVIAHLERIIFYDIDHDGYEERLQMVNNPINGFYYIKIYKDYQKGLIDQFNFSHPVVHNQPAFLDINGDGWDELFVFSNNDDSLYLSVIDAANMRFIQKNHPILSSSPQRARKHWDIDRINLAFTDLDNDGQTELLFTVNSGYARTPRGIYVYDLRAGKINKRFEYHLGAAHFAVVDFRKNGQKFIALGSTATNNFAKNLPLSDAYSWFGLLDHNLKPVKTFRRLGGKFSSAVVRKLDLGTKEKILLYANRPGDTNKLMVINPNLTIAHEKDIESTISSFRIDPTPSNPKIVYATDSGQIFQLDSSLKLIKKINSPSQNPILICDAIADFLPTKGNEYLFWNKNGFYLFDRQLRLQASFPFPTPVAIKDIYRITWPEFPLPRIAYTDSHGNYELILLPEKKYGRILWYFFPVFLIIFGFSILLFWGFQKINQFVSYFFFSLKESDNAIILLNYRGRVVLVNRKVNQFLHLNPPLQKGLLFTEALSKHTKILQNFLKAQKEGKQIKDSFSYEDSDSIFVGEIAVTPFFTLFNFVHTFLIEIKDSTQQVLLERQRNWQRNIRKMVHDIKTPIAGVQLKLQTLYMKLSETHPELDKDLYNELEEAYSELKRIRNISKNFLKFNDLEEMQIKPIPIHQFLENVLKPFRLYDQEQLHIKTIVHPHIPKQVQWDERQIELLLHILIENSIDAVQNSGEVIIEIKPSSQIRNTAQPWLEFRIMDNGCGIPAQFQHKIFEPHFSTKKEGSGLGLSFAKHIVQQHGGFIRFHSHENSGTVFIVVLPAIVQQKQGRLHASNTGR